MAIETTVQAGEMTERVAIERFAVTGRTAEGGDITDPDVVHNCWAKVEHLDGSEIFGAHQVSAQQHSRFTIRYKAGIDTTMTIRNRERLYDIKSVINPNSAFIILQITAQLRPMERTP